MNYYKVTAKCGHVGKEFYCPGEFFIKANSGKEAAKIARKLPRVKHDRKDAILSVVKIEKTMYIIGVKSKRFNPYFHCKNTQEQNKYQGEINAFIVRDDYREEKENRKSTKKHSLKKNYNIDPLYDLYKNRSNLFEYDIA